MLPDFLTDMAAASTGGDDKKKKTPVVTLPQRSHAAKAVDQLASVLREEKELKGRKEALKSELADTATQRRNAESAKDGRYYSSVRLVGANGSSVTVTPSTRYSKIPMSAREEIEEVLNGEDFDGRFATRVTMTIDNEALQDPSVQGLLERLLKRHKLLKSIFVVSAYYEPKESFVKSQRPDEQRIVDELEDRRIMKPYSPTFR